jgi:hypothetical protein
LARGSFKHSRIYFITLCMFQSWCFHLCTIIKCLPAARPNSPRRKCVTKCPTGRKAALRPLTCSKLYTRIDTRTQTHVHVPQYLLERIATPRNVHFTTAWDQIRGGVGRRRWHRISQCDQEWKLKKVMANVVTKQMTTKMQSKYRVAKELRRARVETHTKPIPAGFRSQWARRICGSWTCEWNSSSRGSDKRHLR